MPPTAAPVKAVPKPRPTEPPANGGAAVGRSLDNAGRSAADAGRTAAKAAGKAPIFSTGQRAAVSGGSIVIGLVAYAIGITYLQHGWPGVTAWFKAKLWNETSQPGNGVTPAMYFHTGSGAGAAPNLTAGTQLAAAPAQPVAPTPSGGILYA